MSYRRKLLLDRPNKYDLERLKKELQKRAWSVWQEINDLLYWAELPGSHKILFKFPIKGPTMEIYDNLDELFAEIEDHLKEGKDG